MQVLPVPSPLRKSPPWIMNSLICDESDAMGLRNHTDQETGTVKIKQSMSDIQRDEICCLCSPEAVLAGFCSRLCNIDESFQLFLE